MISRMITLQAIEEAVGLLRAGQVGVLPTDTVYGLVARADNPEAVARLYALKSREHKPGTIIAASVDQLVELGIAADQLQRVSHWWPGPLSVVVPAGQQLEYLHQGLVSLALRVPQDPMVRRLLEQTGPLATTSANQPGEPVAGNVAEAAAYFGDNVDFYVDGGSLPDRLPSTIIRLQEDGIEILREGAVAIHPSKAGCPLCLPNGLLRGSIMAHTPEAFLIAAQSLPGNYLIIPKQHVENPVDLPAEWWGSVQALLPEVPGLLRHYNLTFNIGKLAGQSIAHLHMWVVPRRSGSASSGKGLATLIRETDESAGTAKPGNKPARPA